MVDPTLRSINRLFVISFRNCDNDPTRNSFDKYYLINALIDNNSFFDQASKIQIINI